MELAAELKHWSALPCLGGSSQYIAADMQILWQLVHFRPLSVYSRSLSFSLSLSPSPSLSAPSSLLDVTVHPVYRGRSAQATAAATAGSDARSLEELQWRHTLTSCLLLLLSHPVPLLPTHSSFCLHARVPLPMPGHRTQGQGGVEEEGAQLQPVGRGYGLACMEPTG